VSDSKFDKMVNVEWPVLWETVKTMDSHMVECDDAEGLLTVMADSMGDFHMWLTPGRNMTGLSPSFRARTTGGGGRYERIRIALALLALAIAEDVEV
jgi:hypothetical protein